jgi:outer membrane receptor protein involved in Fe transport
MSNRFNKAALLSGGAFAALALANPAFAQVTDEDDATDQETAIQTSEGMEGEPTTTTRVTITGSRIVRDDLDTAAPIAVVQDEEFKLSGTVNAEQVINTLPQVIPGTTAFSNNPGNGTATLNLRGLGTNRNLVLVNGRRYMFFDTSQVVDLNTIPTFLVGSVDVVTGGASAVYGSDAIAGVTNFKLRYVDGIEAGGQYSITERGDGARYNVFTALGAEFDDGRGRATIYGEYYNREGVFQGDRAFSNFALSETVFGPPLVQGGSSTLPSGVLRYLGGAQGDATLPAGTEFGAAGARGFGTGVVFDEPANFRRRTGDAYNYAPVNYLMIPQERYLIGGHAEYEIGNGHEAYAEVSYANNRVQQELAATPVTGNFNVNIAAVSPFLVASDVAQLNAIDQEETNTNTANGNPDDPGVVNFFVQRRTVETGARNSLDERNAFRILTGLNGPITETFNYDAYYMYARTRNANVQAGNISRSNFQAGLDGTASPINIFGPNTLTPAMVDQISIQAQNGDISTLQVVSGVVSGTFGNLGMGADDLGIALGAEYRKVTAQFIPDTALSSGDVIGFNAGNPTEGSYDVTEGFVELNLPIIATDSGLTLDVTGAARYSDYSLANVGGVWTYAGGATFSPVPDITFRGQYQRAVRAPNIAELFGGNSIGFPGASDPCAAPGAATDATVAGLCTATGVPAAFVGDPNLQPNSQIPAIFGGNANLEEEVSDSITAGVVLSPSFIPGLNITADWYNIQVEGVITSLGGGLNNTLDLCYNVIQDINSIYCQAIVGARSAGGAITVANPPFVGNANGALLEVEGVDVQLDYGTPVPFSIFDSEEDARLNFFFLATYTIKNNFTPVAALPSQVNECAGRFGTFSCGEPTPEFKATSRVSYIDGPSTISLRWRHIGETLDDNPNVDYAAFGGNERLEATNYFDLSFAFDITESFTLSAGVNNLFDKLPETPIFNAAGEVTNSPASLLLGDNQEQANTYPSTYDVLGRDFFISARMQF